ncbi:MAG: hypothetical protein IPK82_18020 [Polyangiaceae bacterium]|nr:hypothetical protein [Polyangiaceae bacterium]
MRRLWTRALMLGAIGLAAGSSAGCAEERDPIMQVQPNALAKSFFVGRDLQGSTDDPEFYFQTTLVDVGYGAQQDGLFTSTYAQPLSRIKWQVTENFLIARITYERINNSDGKGAGPASNDGVIAAVYPIQSHFDIRRAYNPSTGEEQNTIVENGQDRPWNLREYFRVDWSQNLATDSYDFDTLSLVGLYGGVTYEPLAYYINDPKDPDAPHFNAEEGYFDVTNKAFATPGLVDLSSFGWGIDSFPACFLDADFAGGTAPSGSCNPVELTLRQSFRRVGQAKRDASGNIVKNDVGEIVYQPSDFEPKHWDGFRFQQFGAFYEERLGYARNYGMVDEQWRRLIDRYDIWQRNHYYADPVEMTGEVKCFVPTEVCADGSCVGTPYGADPNRDLVDGTGAPAPNGIADECEKVGAGSYCDDLSQKCTLPYRSRLSKPVVWYYTMESHPDYFESTGWAAQEWDIAMRNAANSAKYAECVKFTGDVGGCNNQFPVLRSQQDSNWDAVQLANEVDHCRHTGGSNCEALADQIGGERGYEFEVIALAKQAEMIVFCHSPVEANDPEACAPADKRLPDGMTAAQCFAARKSGDTATMDTCERALTVRMGDLRYNQVNAMIAPQTPSPWGIMVDSEDPLTGEKLASSINVWTHVNDLFSQGIVDTSRYIKGELATADITDGKYVKDWASAADAAGSKGSAGQFTREEARRRIAAISGKEISLEKEGEVGKEVLEQNPAIRAKLKKAMDEARTIMAEVGAGSNNAPAYAARLRALAGTDIEAELMTKPMQQFAGVDGMPPSDAVMNLASPVRGGNRSIQRSVGRFKQEALGRRGACILSSDDAMSAAPLAIADLATVLEEKFGAFNAGDTPDVQQARAEKMRKYIAQKAHYSVIAHEMGHSIALRHNFVSSSDAYNYRSQYWQLRTKNNTVNTVCDDLTAASGENCIGPRYFDPITPNEKKNLIWMWMHSSTMDYAGEISQDMLGLGAYDFAAARMFYGDTVAVYEDPTFNVGTAKGRGVIEKIGGRFGGLLGIEYQFGKNPAPIHYSQIADKFGVIQNCVDVDPNVFKPKNWDEATMGVWHPVLDGLIVSANGSTYSRCRQPRVDIVQWNSMRKPNVGSESGDFYGGGPAIDPVGRTLVPYGFATDRWADLGNVAVYRHDNGADVYELFDFFITQQEVGHIFDNYRRGRKSFSVRGAANRTLGRYNEKMRDGAKGLGLLVNIFKDLAVEAGLRQDDIVDFALREFYPNNTLASGIAFDHFTRMMARPEPVEHITLGDDPVLRPRTIFFSSAAGDEPTKLIVNNGATGFYGNVSYGGKLLENTLAENQGEYDAEFTMNCGSYYDKMYTTMLLTESEDNFISDSIGDFYDARYRSVSMADVFREGYRRWLGNNLTGDDVIKGVRVAAKANGDPDVDQDMFSKFPMGTTSWWPTNGPEVCFPNENSIVCSQYGINGAAQFDPQAIPNTAVVDPLVGWEQQKFLITWTYVYLPENQKRYWLDRLQMMEVGKDNNPEWDSQIELHIPGGSTYVARTFGTEVIFGKQVQKGPSARVLQYANELLASAYQGSWYNRYGQLPDEDLVTPGIQQTPSINDWFIADIDSQDGLAIVKFDPGMVALAANGAGLPNGTPGCSSTPGDNLDCTCEMNKACVTLDKYKSVPWFLARMDTWIKVGAKGLYPESL